MAKTTRRKQVPVPQGHDDHIGIREVVDRLGKDTNLALVVAEALFRKVAIEYHTGKALTPGEIASASDDVEALLYVAALAQDVRKHLGKMREPPPVPRARPALRLVQGGAQ